MGIIRALISSSCRFEDSDLLMPIGYEKRPIQWFANVDPVKGHVDLSGPHKLDQILAVPARADRSGKVSRSNIKPNLLADNANYSLGLSGGTTTELAFDSFVKLQRTCLLALRKYKAMSGSSFSDLDEAIKQLTLIVRFLELPADDRRDAIKSEKARRPKPGELVSFSAGSVHPFDLVPVQRFWARYLGRVCGAGRATCSVCGGSSRELLRIVPFKVRLAGERCPITAVNTDEQQSFGSHGKAQLANSPVCLPCAGSADRALKYLLTMANGSDGKPPVSGPHAVILERDDSGKQPLKNQIAVFWTKDLVAIEAGEEGTGAARPRSLEDAIRAPLVEIDEMAGQSPPAFASQMRTLLNAPYRGASHGEEFATNRFYFAVLSPNKSRLVVRDWIEQDVEPVRVQVKRYVSALQLIHPEGHGVSFPPLPALLRALRSVTSNKQDYREKPRLPSVGPDAVRRLIRCIYAGDSPPGALLARAVRCFRVPDPPTEDRAQLERQWQRRMAMVASMKLILTHSATEEEQRAMEELRTEHDDCSAYKRHAPYLCGRLLAVLEAAQRRASSSGRGVGATLVDKFYGSASTAPAMVFANLINMATKAHLPKLRRESKEIFRNRSSEKGRVNINDLVAEVCAAIDAAGGFPPPLSPEEQAQFALGFYHQRADFNP